MDEMQRILVVDDEVGPREALRVILDPKYRVITGVNGPEALQLVRRTQPALVFLDVMMPGMNGLEVLKAIKQVDSGIEAILMTACASFEIARDAMTYGASEYLLKPFSEDEVEGAVAKALARRAERLAPRLEAHTLAAQLRTVREGSQVILGHLELADALQTIGARLQSGLGYAGLYVWLCGQDGMSLWEAYGRGLNPGWQPHDAECGLPDELQVDRLPAAHVILAPIVVDGAPVGVIKAVREADQGTIVEVEVEVFRILLDAMALALKNARLQERLRQAEKLRALGEVAAGIAHNFNNTLATILGRTQLMAYQPGNLEALQKSLAIIEKVAEDGTAMVRRIQEFAKKTATSAFRPTDLGQVVQEAVEATQLLWKDQAQRRGRRVEVVMDLGRVPAVHGRAAELREVLTNLILNAVDAMPEGGRLTLRTGQRGGRAYMEVSDTGMGMSEEVRQRIFEPFFTTKGAKGTGLGLSASQTLIKGHGGEIEVQSEVGQGTTFVITLPIEPGIKDSDE
jgi:signal transduction histidine kinase